MTVHRRKIIIDTDPGQDDAFALLLALPEPGTVGNWQTSEEHVWRFVADDGRCRGFVLGGKQTALRAKAMQWLAA